MNTPASTIALAATLRDHFARVVLPIWRGPGFNAALHLPYEAVSADAGHLPMPVERYRAMACARQLFVFSQAGEAAHAHVLFEALLHYFHDKQRGGWFYSVDARRRATRRDEGPLYARVTWSSRALNMPRRFGNRDALDLVHGTSALIEARFAAQHGLFNAALDADFSTVAGTPVQNPLMHLTEAWLAAREATQDRAFDSALRKLADAIERTFVHAPTGCIAELPLGVDDNRLEPGHQFEWFWLVRRAGALLDGVGARRRALARVRVCAATWRGSCSPAACAPRSSTKPVRSKGRHPADLGRKANICAHSPPATMTPRAPCCSTGQIERFRQRFLHAQGWFECKTAAGDVSRADMPSTTPYHLATAYAALPA